VAVVGGGPAGLVAAYHAARSGARVVLLDRNADPGRKIVLSGGGRCNVLPTSVDPSRFVSDSSKNTLRKILLAWPLDGVRAFLERDVGLRLREEVNTGKLFPVSGGGREVRRRLVACVRRAGVALEMGAVVTAVDPGAPHRIHLRDGGVVQARRVVLATGGLSYPQTGSDGSGIGIAGSLGHTIVTPYPALVALYGGRSEHRSLAGISLRVALTVCDGKKRVRSEGGFLFTHRGYSGPAVLNIGHMLARPGGAGRPPRILVSWSERTPEEWTAELAEGRRTVRSVVREVLPERLAVALLRELDLGEATCGALGAVRCRRLVEALTAYPLPWSASGGFEEAEVTGGGIHLSQVDPKSLRSRIVPGLHFCGEMLDAFGPIGGTNFLWAFVTGKLAGEAASVDGGIRVGRAPATPRPGACCGTAS
jgi:predicted Rossmann fold flavoprotein